MISEPKPFASLGPTLLARKGGARPAMRPQFAAMPAAALQPMAPSEVDLEDLGWNDMGPAEPELEQQTAAEPAAVPAPAAEDTVVRAFAPVRTAEPAMAETAPEPEVRRQQNAVAAAVAAAPAPRTTPIPRALAAEPRRAAFTLRLDAQRHLKLRLASTVQGRSAQLLVTKALDKFLSEIPEIDALAAQLQRD